MIGPRTAILIVMILLTALYRLVPHPWNVSPVTALALFGAVHYDPKAAFAGPLAAMVLSDVVLNLAIFGGVFHATMPFVYGSVSLAVCLGLTLRHRLTPVRLAAAAMFSSTLFFLATNLGVWLTSSTYPANGAGLAACYVAALPFFQNSLVGDLAFTGIFFGLFALAERRFPVLRRAEQSAEICPAN
jgi:hypothetical protein